VIGQVPKSETSPTAQIPKRFTWWTTSELSSCLTRKISARRIADGAMSPFSMRTQGRKFTRFQNEPRPAAPGRYVNSSVLAFRVADRAATKRLLVLSSIEAFSEVALKRLLVGAKPFPGLVYASDSSHFRIMTLSIHSNGRPSRKRLLSERRFVESVQSILTMATSEL